MQKVEHEFQITRTIYTEEMINNARYNVTHYEWGKKLLKKIIEDAQPYVEHFDLIYDLLPGEGIPRSCKNGTRLAQDDIKSFCPNCGVNIDTHYSDWDYDAINEPWKICCPHCAAKFPTNDFGLLYKRGLDEFGTYHRELAYKNNADAVAKGEKDALVNELQPDKGTTWMVDDGFGWSPKFGTYGTNDLEQYAPIAKYLHMLWFGSHYRIEMQSMRTVLTSLRDAYLYTGEKSYGRAGIILLDRVADLYPDFDLKKICLNYYVPGHGGHYNGKVIGNISEYKFTEILVRCFDAFRPMVYDEEVITYLSKKSQIFKLKNPKTTGELIGKNLEEGILYATWDGIKEAAVWGNFGMHQKIAALTAVAFDKEPITNEIFNWMQKPSVVEYKPFLDPVFGGEFQCVCSNSGGEMVTAFVNEIDRDGFGGEISINYNHFWFNGAVVASILKRYINSNWDLYANPKVRCMFDTFVRMTVGHGYSLLLGDGGRVGEGKLIPFADDMIQGYIDVKDPRMAQIFYLYSGGKIDEEKLGVFSNIEAIKSSVENDIATYGEYEFVSENLTGYGLAIVRGGKFSENKETRYDTWMYYGRVNCSHAHLDMLHMGIDAYGFNFSPDFGDPENKLLTANRHEWIRNTIAHNTVAVGEFGQQEAYGGTPLHFDSTDKVKLIDVESADSYAQTDIYRRTLVTIAANDDVAYTLDFFRVKGGDKHTYSFHSQSYMGYTTDTLELIPQVDEKGEYVGTYAGADVPYGPDPYSRDDKYAEQPKYTRGYTWLKNVNRGTHNADACEFSVNFKQTNFQTFGPDAAALDLNLKFHSLNDWKADNVDIVTGYAPRIPMNKNIPGLDYMFIKRNGENLDTLFTSLLEPYKGECYISKAEQIVAVLKDGKESKDDVVKTVKVSLKSGRVDYIIYATNNDVTYTVTDGAVNFDFKGFVGVYSVDSNGVCVYSYINDGTLIGDKTSVGVYSGTVVDFTKDLVIDNYITIKADQSIEDVSVLENHYIYVDNKGAKCNGSYRIKSARKDGDNIVLSLGNCSLIEQYKDDYNLDAGFVYTIAEGQKFNIPISENSENCHI